MKNTIRRFIAVASFLAVSATANAQYGYFSARPLNAYWPATNGTVWMPAPGSPYGVAQVPVEPVVPVEAVAPVDVLPQTGSSIEASMEPHGQVAIKWEGNAAAVNRIGFAL